jgi:hypothetical protein
MPNPYPYPLLTILVPRPFGTLPELNACALEPSASPRVHIRSWQLAETRLMIKTPVQLWAAGGGLMVLILTGPGIPLRL